MPSTHPALRGNRAEAEPEPSDSDSGPGDDGVDNNDGLLSEVNGLPPAGVRGDTLLLTLARLAG
jgi:hypothetical protein